jgi:predicted Zn-dependent protease
MSSGEKPMTFLGLDKKDWLHREILVDSDKEKIQCLSNALMVDPEDGYLWHTLGDKYADFDEQKAKYCWSHAKNSYQKRLEQFKIDAKKYAKDSSHLLHMEVTSTDVLQIISAMYFSLGSIHMNLSEYELAISAYDKSYSIKDNDPDCLYYSAEANFYLDKLHEAEDRLVKNIKSTNDYKSHYLLGLIRWKKNEFNSSLQSFWNCINASGNDADSCYHKHLAYNALGNSKKTEFYLKKAFEKEPSEERAFDLIKFYEETGKTKLCKKYYDLVHKMHKKSQNTVEEKSKSLAR